MKHNLKPEIVPKVAAIMRSSRQAKAVLRDLDGGLCVLGCMAELAVREQPSVYYWQLDVCEYVLKSKANFVESVCKGKSSLFNSLKAAYTTDGLEPQVEFEDEELIAHTDRVLYEGLRHPLYRLNDSFGFSLDKIADLLEGKL